jgi:hypothetical protein
MVARCVPIADELRPKGELNEVVSLNDQVLAVSLQFRLLLDGKEGCERIRKLSAEGGTEAYRMS